MRRIEVDTIKLLDADERHRLQALRKHVRKACDESHAYCREWQRISASPDVLLAGLSGSTEAFRHAARLVVFNDCLARIDNTLLLDGADVDAIGEATTARALELARALPFGGSPAVIAKQASAAALAELALVIRRVQEDSALGAMKTITNEPGGR